MPGKVKVRVIAGRSLPVMDRSNDTTDAYVEVKLGQVTYKTDVCRKSLNPQWNSEWYKFEVDDMELQDEPLQIRVMDYDTYSANDAIGKVYLDLNPLLINPSSKPKDSGKTISGWIPVYDTMHGLRGEVNLIVKVELFSDLNKYRQSSCGVKFFFSPQIPEGFIAHSLNGFVEELVINDDPEYQWIDKIRTPRASNEARQTLFQKLSGEVQRKVGLKALEVGGNAVIGYKQFIDLEGDSGLVIRGVGTATYLTKTYENQLSPLASADGNAKESLSLCPRRSPRKRNNDDRKRKSPISRHNSRTSPNLPKPLAQNILVPDDTGAPVRRGTLLPAAHTEPHNNMDMVDASEPHARASSALRKSIFLRQAHAKDNFRLLMLKREANLVDSEEEDDQLVVHAIETLSEISEERTSQEGSCGRPGSASAPIPLPFLPICLSEKESDCSVSEDSPPTSPNSTTSSMKKFSILNLRRRHRWLTKRERLSTNCLVKRVASGPVPPASKSSSTSSSSAAKIKEELGKIFKRISFSDTEKPPAEDTRKSIYRQPRKLFFRRRRRSNRSQSQRTRFQHPDKWLVRSNSECESHSLSFRQTSSESLPSIGSEPPPTFSFVDEEDDGNFSEDNNAPLCRSLQDIPTFMGKGEIKEACPEPELVPPPSSGVPVDYDKLKEVVRDLGYDVSKPLKLYISSMDALLVYDPAYEAKNMSCVCLSVDGGGGNDPTLTKIDVDADPEAKKRVNALLEIKHTSSSSVVDIAEPKGHSVELFKRGNRRSRHDTLVECSRHGSSSSCTSTTSTTSTSGGATSSSCCNKAGLVSRRAQGRRSDEEMLQKFDNFERFVKNAHEIGITGCRSPIPEELIIETSGLATSPTKAQRLAPKADGGGLCVGSPEKGKGNRHPGLIHRRSSESDLSGGSLFGKSYIHRPFGFISIEPLLMQEFPFITLSQMSDGFIQYLGGTITARSVKLLKSIGNFEEPSPETRDGWWNELRVEMRSHLRSYGCNVILDYEEHSTLWDEVAIMSASGTAAIVGTDPGDAVDSDTKTKDHGHGHGHSHGHSHRRNDSYPTNVSNGPKSPKAQQQRNNTAESEAVSPCAMLHIPPASLSLPTISRKVRCAYCKKGKVPEFVLATIELPSCLPTTGRSCLIQCEVFRSKKESRGEVGAKEMSDSLPFLEYELHRRLINKLKVKGMNAIFGLKVQITQGDKVVIGMATGTAMFLTPLPIPVHPTINPGTAKTDSQKVLQYQKVIQETFDRNREIFGIKNIVLPHTNGNSTDMDSDDDLDDEEETKDIFMLEVDDAEDIDIITMLVDQSIPMGYNMSNIETPVGLPPQRFVSHQMFSQVWRCKIPTITQRQLTSYFDRLIRMVNFKLRRMQPCILSKMVWTVDLPESDEMQLCLIGMTLGLDKRVAQNTFNGSTNGISTKTQGTVGEGGKGDDESDMIFPFEEEKDKGQANSSHSSSLENLQPTPPLSTSTKVPPPLSSPQGTHQNKALSSSPLPNPNVNIPLPTSKIRHWVEITPLSTVPGARIERYLGNLNFYFIRETASLRESGGIHVFVHTLFTDILAIVRAHVNALGGNAIVSYFMNKCDIMHNPHKNQGQCVINVGGDAVYVSYATVNNDE